MVGSVLSGVNVFIIPAGPLAGADLLMDERFLWSPFPAGGEPFPYECARGQMSGQMPSTFMKCL